MGTPLSTEGRTIPLSRERERVAVATTGMHLLARMANRRFQDVQGSPEMPSLPVSKHPHAKGGSWAAFPRPLSKIALSSEREERRDTSTFVSAYLAFSEL